MSSKKQENLSLADRFDKAKWVCSIILLIAGLAVNYYFLQIPASLRTLGWIILLCVIFAIVSQTAIGHKSWKFFREARNEIRKVVWPTRQETMQTTLLVVAVVIAFAFILWGIDSILLLAINWLTT